MESRKQEKSRFHIEKLEERIAPTTLTAAPDANAGTNAPSISTTATVDSNAAVANGDGGVTVS